LVVCIPACRLHSLESLAACPHWPLALLVAKSNIKRFQCLHMLPTFLREGEAALCLQFGAMIYDIPMMHELV
jgi:hypothetical protein